jgi:hypothetical protein
MTAAAAPVVSAAMAEGLDRTQGPRDFLETIWLVGD